MTFSFPRAALAAVAVGVLALSACSGDATGAGAAAEDTGATTLKLWHYESANGAMGAAWDKAIEIFKKEHPGVTVEFERKAFEQIQQNAGMILNSDRGPRPHGVQQGQRDGRAAGLTGPAHRPDRRGAEARLGQEAEPQPPDHRQVRRQGRHGWQHLVRRAQLRRVRDGLLQQGPLHEERRQAPHHVRRARVGPGGLQGQGNRRSRHVRRRVPRRPALLPARALQGRPLVRRQLPALQGRGRLHTPTR